MTKTWRSELQLAWQGQLSDLVTAVVYSPDGHSWVASSAAGEVAWNSGSTVMTALQAANGQSIDGIAFSYNSRWLAAGGQAGQLLIWNCDDPTLPPTLVRTIKVDRWIEHLTWHPTQPYLAISYGAEVKIWDIAEDREIATWKFARSSVFDLAWQPTGAYLAVAGYKGVQIWSPSDGKIPHQHINSETTSITIAWSDDSRYLAVGNLDRTLTIVDWNNPTDPWILQGCPGKIRQIIWITGNTTPCLAVASGSAVVIWKMTADLTTWNGQLLESHQATVESLAAHPQSPIFASGGTDGYTCLWSIDGSIEQIITDDVSRFTTLAWHPHRDCLVTGSQIGTIGLWIIPA